MKLKAFSLITVVLTTSASLGLTRLQDIHSPDQCPSHLEIEAIPSDPDDGTFTVKIRFSPEAPGLYAGRIKASGRLTVKSDDELLAETNLASSQDGELFQFAFRLGVSAFEQSELTLSTQLYEQDGYPTLGGGQIYRIHLKGFLPPGYSPRP